MGVAEIHSPPLIIRMFCRLAVTGRNGQAPRGRLLGAVVVKARLTLSSRGSGTAGCSDAAVSGVCTAQWQSSLAATVISSWKLLWHKFGHCSLLSRCKPGYLLFNQVCELFNIFFIGWPKNLFEAFLYHLIFSTQHSIVTHRHCTCL